MLRQTDSLGTRYHLGKVYIPLDEELPEVPDEDLEETTAAALEASCSQSDFIHQQKKDDSLEEYWLQARDNPGKPYQVVDGMLVWEDTDLQGEKTQLLVILEKHRRQVFKEAHSALLGGHFGHRKTKAKVCRMYFRPGLDRDLKQWRATCQTCQLGNKTKTVKAPLVPLLVISTPWERVAFDVVGPLPKSKAGYRYILMAMDFTTRFPKATALKRIDAQTVAQAIVEIYTCYEIPAEILTDNGSCFVNALQTELCGMLGIHSIKISPHNPRSNRMLERWHRVLKTVIVKSGLTREWDKVVPLALFASRDTPHTTTELSPFEVLFGRQVRGPITVLRQIWQTPKKVKTSILQYTCRHSGREWRSQRKSSPTWKKKPRRRPKPTMI